MATTGLRVEIRAVKRFGLEQFLVYVAGVHVADAWSVQGARLRAAEYLRRLRRV